MPNNLNANQSVERSGSSRRFEAGTLGDGNAQFKGFDNKRWLTRSSGKVEIEYIIGEEMACRFQRESRCGQRSPNWLSRGGRDIFFSHLPPCSQMLSCLTPQHGKRKENVHETERAHPGLLQVLEPLRDSGRIGRLRRYRNVWAPKLELQASLTRL